MATYNFTLSTIKPGIRAVVLPDGSTPYLVLSNWNETSGTWYDVVDFDQEVIDDANPDFNWHKRRPRWDTRQYATNGYHPTTLPKSPTRAAHECFGTLWKAKRAITEVLEEPRPMVGDATWVRQSAEAAAENAEPEPSGRQVKRYGTEYDKQAREWFVTDSEATEGYVESDTKETAQALAEALNERDEYKAALLELLGERNDLLAALRALVDAANVPTGWIDAKSAAKAAIAKAGGAK